MTLCLNSPLILHPLSHYSCCVRTHEQVESLNVKWSEFCSVAQIENPGEMLVARTKLPCSLWAYIWPFRTHSKHRFDGAKRIYAFADECRIMYWENTSSCLPSAFWEFHHMSATEAVGNTAPSSNPFNFSGKWHPIAASFRNCLGYQKTKKFHFLIRSLHFSLCSALSASHMFGRGWKALSKYIYTDTDRHTRMRIQSWVSQAYGQS